MDIVASTGRSVLTSAPNSAGSWQQILKEAVRDPAELCRLLQLDSKYLDGSRQANDGFEVFVPRGYLAKMKPGDPRDPLLRQVLPLEDELQAQPGFADDPVGDQLAEVTPGLLRKYRSRVLMVATGACAVHCRYCFRRHFPYSQAPRSIQAWHPAFQQIEADPSIEEVLLSGGDPLTLVDDLLSELAERISRVPHVQRLRIHSRLPIVIPERVTDAFLSWFTGTRLTPIMVIHANHPAELDEPVARSLGMLSDAGIPVLNQAVLLRGVNDDLKTLTELSLRLVDLRIMPYYLHQLDRVTGAAHFEVPVEHGIRLVKDLRQRLPGYAVPRFVQERAGAQQKFVLA